LSQSLTAGGRDLSTEMREVAAFLLKSSKEESVM